MDSNGFASAGQAIPYQFVIDAAHIYLASGRSIGGPIPPNSKFPEGNGWKLYQKKLPTEQKISSWFDSRFLQGLCIICGKVSGGLEVIDFDDMPIYETFVHLVSEVGYHDLIQRLVIEHTPKPGVHLGYLCEVIEGNRKLAREQIGILPNGKPDIKTLIETRGEGGLIVAAPTPPGIHPDHRERGYELVQGDWTRPPQITPEERDILWNCARALNRYDKDAHRSYSPPKSDHNRVGNDYNERVTHDEVRELLEADGWKRTLRRNEGDYLLRPGKSGRGWSATLGIVGPKRLYVFSTNADPFDHDRSYDPFGIYMRLKHGGDPAAAAKALAALGYGRNGQPHHEDTGNREDGSYHRPEEGDDHKQSTDPKQRRTFGGVSETVNGYYRIRTVKEQPVRTQISSFIVKPTLRIWVDGSEAVRANIKVRDETLGEVTIERHSWHSRGAFLKILTSLDQWCIATDNEIQAIQAMVAMQQVPSKRGTRTLGLVDGVWVSDEGIFNASGWIHDPDLVYLPVSGESPLAGRLCYRVSDPSQRLSVAQSFYDRVWKLNELTVIGALIGWFFATPFKPQIHRRLNHFPILNVWGTMGAGKTSLLRLFWKLLGVDSELLACTDTEFSLLSLLSATSSIPLVFDEFKPYDMKPDQVRRFERILRRVYDGDTEHRGRPDLRLITYHLMAPVAVAGEVSVARQPAMRERIIPVSPSKTWLPEHEEARQAYWELVKLPVHAFASFFIEWSMHQDFADSWTNAENVLSECMNRDVPERIRDGLRVISFGLRQYEQFGMEYGLPVPEQIDLGAICEGIVSQLVNANGVARVGLDALLEHLASMAEMGRLMDGKHYHVDMGQDRLAFRLDSCLAEYRRYAKDTASDDEVLSKEAYLRQLRENHESKGYVLAVSERVYYTSSAADRLRSVVISISKAEDSGIDLGGFTRNHE